MKRLAFCLLLAACSSATPPGPDAGGLDAGSPDAGSPDAGAPDAGAADAGHDSGTPDAGAAGRYWDGGTCAVKTDCPCFSNDDCGPGFRCVSEDNTGTQVWCVPGARGTGAPGDVCSVEGDCASALCVEPNMGPSRCSRLCEQASECPPTLPRCLYIGFGVDRSICSPPP